MHILLYVHKLPTALMSIIDSYMYIYEYVIYNIHVEYVLYAHSMYVRILSAALVDLHRHDMQYTCRIYSI